MNYENISVNQLIDRYQSKHPNGHFFDRETLKFFGERISEMRVLKGTVIVTSCGGEKHKCYMLSSRQHNHPGGPKRVYHYFDVETYDDVIV